MSDCTVGPTVDFLDDDLAIPIFNQILNSKDPDLSRFPICPDSSALPAAELLPRPSIAPPFQVAYPSMAEVYNAVSRVGLPNYRGARVPLQHA